MRPKRPLSSPAPGDSVASALAGAWPLLVLGDADGTLLAWDLTTGRCNALATGVPWTLHHSHRIYVHFP